MAGKDITAKTQSHQPHLHTMYRSPNKSSKENFSPSKLDTMNFNAFMKDMNFDDDFENITTSFNLSDYDIDADDSEKCQELEMKIRDLERERDGIMIEIIIITRYFIFKIFFCVEMMSH